MSSFWLTARTMQTLSIVALEEASREGRKDADLEHLFLALLLSDQPAGDALRGLGITLDSARAAVQDLRSDQLGSLGIEASVPHEGRIVLHEQTGHEWVDRVTAVFQDATSKKRDGSATEVLKSLVNEPSGTIEDVLGRLGTTPAEVTAAADRAASNAPPPARLTERTAATSTAFVPAALEDVWDFLADPRTIPAWNLGIESVDAPEGTMRVGQAFAGRTPDRAPVSANASEGAAAPKNPAAPRDPRYQRKTIELALAEPSTRIAWRISQPDAPESNATQVGFTLHPTPGGTRLTVRSTWIPGRRTWRKLVLAPFRPVFRALGWLGANHYALGVSRAFR